MADQWSGFRQLVAGKLTFSHKSMALVILD